jgi:2-octaprenyl-6-methoxyphenol hydroxylase
MNSKHYDVVIAGGGMIGTSLALALAPLGLCVAVVEAVARKAPGQPSFDDRSTALSRSTQRMFEAMGLWPEIVAASTPIRGIHVSDQGRFGFSHIDAREQGVEALGYVVINRVLGGVLQDAVNDVDGVDVICPARIVGLELGPDRAAATVADADGETRALTCDLMVAADGANSVVREMMGITAQKSDYGQRAVIGNLLPEKDIDFMAYERFTQQGPLAILPVADGRAGFVWTPGGVTGAVWLPAGYVFARRQARIVSARPEQGDAAYRDAQRADRQLRARFAPCLCAGFQPWHA